MVRQGDRVLLVQRRNPPDAGWWGFPGGKVRLGETVMDAATRELSEETGVEATAERVLTALDALDRDSDGTLRHHHVLVAVLCHWVRGEPVAGDDAQSARWVPLSELEDGSLRLSLNVGQVARMATAVA